MGEIKSSQLMTVRSCKAVSTWSINILSHYNTLMLIFVISARFLTAKTTVKLALMDPYIMVTFPPLVNLRPSPGENIYNSNQIFIY